jgi:hypothetical protein
MTLLRFTVSSFPSLSISIAASPIFLDTKWGPEKYGMSFDNLSRAAAG